MSYRLRVTAAIAYLPNCLRRSYSAWRDTLRFLSVSCEIAISRRAKRMLLRSTRMPVFGLTSSGQGLIRGCSFTNRDLSQAIIAGPLRYVDQGDLIAGLDAEEEDAVRREAKTGNQRCRGGPSSLTEEACHSLRGRGADRDNARVLVERVRGRGCAAGSDRLIGERGFRASLGRAHA